MPTPTDPSDADAGTWAFRPLRAVTPPSVRDSAWGTTPIDRFILAPIEAGGLAPAPAASRRVLLRRLHFDLLGLPPSAEEVREFEEEPGPFAAAWRRVVRSLLNRPQFGERWARHWLDVARFAESSGFEHDYDRPSAYHYRDFVIRAWNDDMPYDQFVRWQIAGDEFAPDEPLALMATGFLGAGVFPTQITANEVERTRYDAMDDMLATTGTAMLGLTIGCARCHDHKSDPISSRDYYRMLATFTTTTRSELELDLEPAVYRSEKQRHDLAGAPLEAALRRYERHELPAKFDAWILAGAGEGDGTGARARARAGARGKAGGAGTDGEPSESERFWKAQSGWLGLDFTRTHSDAGASFRRLDDFSYRVEGKNGDSDRYLLVADASDLAAIGALRLEAMSDPGLVKGGPGRADNGNFALGRIRAFLDGGNGTSNEIRFASASATFEQNSGSLSVRAALDDNPKTGWAIDPRFGTNHTAAFFVDPPVIPRDGERLVVTMEFGVNARHNLGRFRMAISPTATAPVDGTAVPARVGELLGRLAGARLNPVPLTSVERTVLLDWWRPRDRRWKALSSAVEAHLQSAPKPRLTKVLTCVEGHTPVRMHTQGADFFPETHFLNRGSTDQKRGVATQGFLPLLSRGDSDRNWAWSPPAGAKYSGRRRALANWMTDVERGAGALLARVIVNRLWQHHFGRGLVETPNDFGALGGRPTHPELLDWLASELVRQGWKLKPIHELMLESAAYQVDSDREAASGSGESGGPGSYRVFRPRRLTAEAIRDSLLFVTGVLDPKMYGPGTLDSASVRRSIYFTVKRSQMIPVLQAFDVPEPLVSQATRPATTVAPQALFLMNNSQVRNWVRHYARRLISDDPEGAPAARVGRVFRAALSREPADAEREFSLAFLRARMQAYREQDSRTDGVEEIETTALAELVQTLVSLNEFIHVE